MLNRYFPLLFFLLASIPPSFPTPILNNELLQTLHNKGSTNIVLTTKDGRVQNILQSINFRNNPDRSERLNIIAQTLKSAAQKYQANILEFLAKEKSSASVYPFWITNKIIIRGADLPLVHKLMSRSDLAEIREEIVIPLEDTSVQVDVVGSNEIKAGEQWGISKIRAPDVWAEGYSGEGVVVANIDTGVRVTHESLRSNHRENYGWYDPFENSAVPNDPHGHGTHIMGVIVGTTQGIGVAPNATWIACKGCEPYFCNERELLACGQFIACPTDTAGQNPDCSQAPMVVSNSWGGTAENLWYDDVITTWKAGKIFPLFSIGNSGPECNSGSYPGISSLAVGVGASDENDKVTGFSGLGPSVDGTLIKPNIVAPGQNVYSASHENDTGYVLMQGTSIACPHAAGLATLVLNKNPKVGFNIIKQILENGAIPMSGEGEECGGLNDETVPNNHFGWGRIDALNSIHEI